MKFLHRRFKRMHPQKLRTSLLAALRLVLGLATIPALLFLMLLAYFALATGVGSAEDFKKSMVASGVAFAGMGLIVLGWVIYGLRGGWRIGFALPCFCVILFGLLGVFAGI